MPQPKSSGAKKKSAPARKSAARKPAAAKSSAAKRSTTSARKSTGRKASARKSPARKSAARKAPARKAPAPRAPATASGRSGFPFDFVVLTRDRLQEVADEAVERGRMTRSDAEDLVRDLLRTARGQTDDLIAQIESLAGSVTGSAQVDRVTREVDRARRAVGVGPSFPILRYDDLTAGQVTDRVTDLSAAELRKVRDYERRNANRKSVLDAIEKQLG
jgi:polyhydroxyalkanoate synthesis regulator phasin